jgi:hypothetical protein
MNGSSSSPKQGGVNESTYEAGILVDKTQIRSIVETGIELAVSARRAR